MKRNVWLQDKTYSRKMALQNVLNTTKIRSKMAGGGGGLMCLNRMTKLLFTCN